MFLANISEGNTTRKTSLFYIPQRKDYGGVHSVLLLLNLGVMDYSISGYILRFYIKNTKSPPQPDGNKYDTYM